MNISSNIHLGAENVAEVQKINDDCWSVHLRAGPNSYDGLAIFVRDEKAADALRDALAGAIAAEAAFEDRRTTEPVPA